MLVGDVYNLVIVSVFEMQFITLYLGPIDPSHLKLLPERNWINES